MRIQLVLPLLFSARAVADSAKVSGQALDIAARGGASLVGANVAARLAYGSGSADLVLDLVAQRGRWYPRGVPTEDVVTVEARAGARLTLLDRGVAAFELTPTAGIWRHGGADPLLAIGGEIDATAVVRPRRGVRLHTGIAVPVALSVDGEVDRLEQRLHAGVDVAVGRTVWLTAELHGGGAYGYDGDGTKFDAGVLVGLRFADLEDAPTAAHGSGSARAFVSTEYRALGVGDHYSHGLGFAVGAAILGGHLRVGLAGFNRPGPINPKTFDTAPVDGQSWNGSSMVALRSDGNFVGLHVAPTVEVGPLRLSVPITVGQAAFGFYLHGEDRKAVMGERVSEVENRLFAGKDSSFAVGAEAGITVAWRATDWVAPYASFHYLTTIGYDALGRDNYGGPSGSLGIELTP